MTATRQIAVFLCQLCKRASLPRHPGPILTPSSSRPRPVLYLSPASPAPAAVSISAYCPEKSILGGGLKDLSQEYYSTARRSDKPPVTASWDGAGQNHAPHLGATAFSPGRGEELHKGQSMEQNSISAGY
ncbi:hypothetical protein DPEC_G00161880 [Dallia pectoralis]|uniref:Uncharacterized protein n=1 Tax=Dallia pectoralis TaxID=75939 RepID=A0ACC2GGR3_DALPE|nr:hypothetical protein DPEC_G00161880 [Dallia pectoralis]